jgi:hypothetical protein
LVRTFDEDIQPRAARLLGTPLDVDRDGRFTILLTGWLNRLCDGKVALGGFVRGSDFYRDLRAPFGNRCDMMYLNANLRPGPHLRTLVAHEYTHAIVFSEHVFGDYLPGVERRDEEGWLNEGLAHLAEELHGHGWSNLDYRVAAFLDAPEHCPLVVPDYHAANLWRHHGVRGATFLFLRWCARHHGPDLAKCLIQTNLTGLANLEVATGRPFADLFRRWAVSLLDDPDLRKPLGVRSLRGPRVHDLSPRSGELEVDLAGTAVAFVRLPSNSGSGLRLVVTAPPEADLQVTLVRRTPDRVPLINQVDGGERIP